MEGAGEPSNPCEKQEESTECSPIVVSKVDQDRGEAADLQKSPEGQQASVVRRMEELTVSDQLSAAPEILLKPLQDNPAGFKIVGTGYSYEGETSDGKMHGFGRLILSIDQFLEGDWEANQLFSLRLCRLTCDDVHQTVSIVKQCEYYLLSACGDEFLAHVHPSALRELDFSASVNTLKMSFFRKLEVSNILRDTVSNAEGNISDGFMTEQHRLLFKGVQDPIDHLNSLMFLCKHLNEPYLFSMLTDDDSHNIRLMQTATNMRSSKVLQSLNLKRVLADLVSFRTDEYRQLLSNLCPKGIPRLAAEIENLPSSKILYITKEDIAVFESLVTLLGFEQHETFFGQVVERYIQTLNNIPEYTPPGKLIPLMSPVYSYLVKSFLEVTSEIVEVQDGSTSADLMACGYEGVREFFTWPVDQKSVQETGICQPPGIEPKISQNYRKSLMVRYSLISELMKRYSPDENLKSKVYEYEFQVLVQGSVPVDQNIDDSMLRVPEGLPDVHRVCLYILDHAISEVLKGGELHLELLKPYDNLLRRHISSVGTFEDCEVVRALTEGVVKFVMYSAPFVIDAPGEPSDDFIVFTRQMRTILAAYRDVQVRPSICRQVTDLMAEYSRYWSYRSLVIIEHASGLFSPQISTVMQQVICIVMNSLSKSAPSTTWIAYFKSINRFLNGLRTINFSACWFVKIEFNDPEIMEKVDNYFSKEVYRVTDVEAFVRVQQTRGKPIPNHHVIRVVSKWLECVQMCLRRVWANKAKPLHGSRLECAGAIFDVIGEYFEHLAEPSDFIDYETPETHMVEPFVRLVKHVANLMYFLERVAKMVELIKQGLWCIGKMDRDSINQSLQTLTSVNESIVPEKLLDCYKPFLNEYRRFILAHSSRLSSNKYDIMVPKEAMHFSEWTEEFKTRAVVRILADVCAIWSSSTDTFQMPHCHQILCAFILLGLDQSEGVKNHLAHVLSGQGKSVILALLAATFALTGHNVKILCYNKYLSSRDRRAFNQFFIMAGVCHKVEYLTLQRLVDFISPRMSFSSEVVNVVMNHTAPAPSTRYIQNTVLLIDESDVLFSPQFYGKVYSTVTSAVLPGLIPVQHQIWKLAKTNKWDAQQIVQFVKRLIDEGVEIGNLFYEMNTFQNKPGTFSLLDTNSGDLRVKEYTNQSLLDDRLLRMAKSALRVAGSFVGWAQSDFQEVRRDVTCFRCPDSDVNDIVFGYCNTFNFLRLINSESAPNHIYRNNHYGCLLLNSGRISYALAPAGLPLILGVGGTVSALTEHERTGLDACGIRIITTFPPSAEVDRNPEFFCTNQLSDWLLTIRDRAEQTAESGRAVLIFFESSKELDLFAKYKGGEPSTITNEMERIVRDARIAEAGLPRAVTLATRSMGRGVDYKADSDVELEGGIHVIQTFFSPDVKEEIHIRGRSRRGANGSYELILCKQHLLKENILSADEPSEPTYSSLDEIRSRLTDELGQRLAAEVDKSNRDHNTTMQFFGMA